MEKESITDPLAFISFFDFDTRQVTEIAEIKGLPLPYASKLTVSPDRRWAVYSQIDREVRDLMLVEEFPLIRGYFGAGVPFSPLNRRL